MAVSFRRKLVLIGLFGLFAAGCGSVAEETAAADPAPEEEATTTTEQVEEETTTTTTELVEETTTTEAPQEETTTTVAEVVEDEVCTDESFSSITFEPIPPFDCQTIYDTTVAILLQNGWDAPPPQSGIFLEVGVLCTVTSEKTYAPESTHVPAIADAVMGVMCDADRSLIVPAA